MEVWKDIPEYEGLYQVSNLGEVKSIGRYLYDINTKEKRYYKREILLKSQPNHKGYLIVKLQKNKNKKTITIHRLVASTFLENKDGLPQVNHIDGNKINNRLDNLEWCDNEYNHKHAVENNLCKTRKVKLIDKENNSYNFDNIHEMFRFLNVKPCGGYTKAINKNKLFHNYYIEDIKE